MDWIQAALAAYACDDPQQKAQQVLALPLPLSAGAEMPVVGLLPAQPGRPAKPALIHPAQVPRRRLGSEQGRAALVHAVAHIEFNAINLALDAALRFPDMPADFYQDWLSVAHDEARHFLMLDARLGQMNTAYGDLPAHNGLWEMAEKTAHDCLARMALVPRLLKARGLDVTPDMIQRLSQAGDEQTGGALRIILEEEVRHVAIGTRWFRHLCAQQGCEPDQRFIELLDEYVPQRKKGGLNMAARREAGFSEFELTAV